MTDPAREMTHARECALLEARIAELERLLEEALEALVWCGGSADFGEGGKAEGGWKKLCEPIIKEAFRTFGRAAIEKAEEEEP